MYTQKLEDREFLNNIINTVRAIVLVLDKRGRIVTFNHYMEELTGRSLKEVQGKDWFSIFLPKEDRNKIRKVFLRAIGGKETQGNINPVVVKNGRLRYIEWYDKTFRKKDGTIFGILSIGIDVTARREVQEGLKESEVKYKMLFENCPDGIAIADIKTLKFVYSNKAMCAMLGYSKEEILKLKIRAIHPKGSLRYVISEFNAQAKRVKVLAKNIPCLRKDGKIVYCDINNAKSVIDGRECNVGFFRDVTARKEAEAGLIVAKEFQDSILDSIQDGISVLDTEMRILRVNKVMEEWYAYAMPLAGKKCFEAYHSRTKPCDVCPTKQTLKSKLSAFEVVPMTGRKGKRIGWQELFTFPLIDQKTGKMQGVIEYVRDITEQKQRQKEFEELKLKYEAILAAAPDIIMEVDKNKVYTWVNKAGFGFFGDDCIGKPTSNYCVNEQETYDIVKPLLEGSEDIIYVESWQRRKDGVNRLLGCWCRVLKDKNGSVTGVLSTARDITELKESDALLRKQKESLEEKNIALSQMLEQIEVEKTKIKEQVAANVEGILIPTLQKLHLKGASGKYTQLLEQNLKDLTSSFGLQVKDKKISLTPKEIEISNMIKNGLSSKDISEMLNVSCLTVNKHRGNIRHKLGISNKDVNLTSFLKES